MTQAPTPPVSGVPGAGNEATGAGPYWVHGHRGYCWSRAFVTATARRPEASRSDREALAVDLLASGAVACECRLPPPGNREWASPGHDARSWKANLRR